MPNEQPEPFCGLRGVCDRSHNGRIAMAIELQIRITMKNILQKRRFYIRASFVAIASLVLTTSA
jgi:hypothetical protein